MGLGVRGLLTTRVLGVLCGDFGRSRRVEVVGWCVHVWCAVWKCVGRRILLAGAAAVKEVVQQEAQGGPQGA